MKQKLKPILKSKYRLTYDIIVENTAFFTIFNFSSARLSFTHTQTPPEYPYKDSLILLCPLSTSTPSLPFHSLPVHISSLTSHDCRQTEEGKTQKEDKQNNQFSTATASTPTPSDPSSSRGTPGLDLQAIVAAAMEDSATPHPPSRDISRSVYRLALGSAGIAISEGFITCHPKLPESVKGLLEPIACIPQSVKERESSPLANPH